MCGIVGLFLKDKSLEPHLGDMLTDMLITMTNRGPDSAGIAIYGDGADAMSKLTLQSANADSDFASLDSELGSIIGANVTLRRMDSRSVLRMPADKIGQGRQEKWRGRSLVILVSN